MHAEQTPEPTLAQLRAILARQEVCRDEERRDLARRMHNELSQKATVLGLKISLLGMDAGNAGLSTALTEKIAELSNLAADLSKSIREITNQVHSKLIDEFGLEDALRYYAKSLEAEMRCSVIVPVADLVLPQSTSLSLYHLVQALVEHVFKPAKATSLEIRLDQRPDQLQLRLSGEHKSEWVQQNDAESELDWLTIQEQALRIQAKLKITTIPNVGTSILCSIPKNHTHQPSEVRGDPFKSP